MCGALDCPTCHPMTYDQEDQTDDGPKDGTEPDDNDEQTSQDEPESR